MSYTVLQATKDVRPGARIVDVELLEGITACRPADRIADDRAAAVVARGCPAEFQRLVGGHYSERANQPWNGGWDNPVAQQLIIDFSQAASVQEAKDIVDELHRIWYYEDPATIMLGTANSMITMQDVVKGYVPHRTLMLDGLWLDR